MRIFLLIFSYFSATVAFSQEPGKSAIVHVSVIDVESGMLLKDQTVLIDRGMITTVLPSRQVKQLKGYRIIHAQGKYLIPGLIDSHIHLHYFFQINQQQLLQAPLNIFLYWGVTGIREASGSVFTKEIIALRDSIERGQNLGPKIYASGIAAASNLKKLNASNYLELIGKFKAMGVDGIKVKFTTFQETKEIIDAAHALQLPVYGHTANAWKPDSTNIQGDFTEGIVDYGINGIMHSGGYAPVVYRALPPAPPADSMDARWIFNESLWFYADEEIEKRLIKRIISHQVWLEPTLTIEQILSSLEQYKNDPGLKFSLSSYKEYEAGWPKLTPAQKDSMLQVFRRKQLFVNKFYKAGGVILAGTDHLYGSSLHKELALLVESGLSAAAALKTATYNNAMALGWLDHLGTITKGKKANLVLLNKNPLEDISNTTTINTVIINGQVLDRKKLDNLLKEASMIVAKYRN